MNSDELISAVGNIGRQAPNSSPIMPVQQNIASPSTITPNDGVRVDEGVMPSSINGVGEEAPSNSSQTPTRIPEVPQRNKSNKSGNNKGGKSGGKTKLISILICVGLLVIIILLIVFKDRGVSSILPDPTPTPSNSDIVQDFQEYEDPFGLGNGDDWITSSFTYSESERAALRRVGYTGDEIEQFQLEEKSAEELIEEAEKLRTEYLEETLAPFYDGRSEEFKALENQTWIGLSPLDENTMPATPEDYDNVKQKETTINTDYEKVTPRGNQLFLKIYTNKTHSNWVYYQCNYRQWNLLEESGNLVVTVTISSFESEAGVYEQWIVDSITVY